MLHRVAKCVLVAQCGTKWYHLLLIVVNRDLCFINLCCRQFFFKPCRASLRHLATSGSVRRRFNVVQVATFNHIEIYY